MASETSPEPDFERNFRRGYHQGFDAALNALSALLFTGTPGPGALARLSRFFDTELTPWREGRDLPQAICPPIYPIGEDVA